VKATIGAIVDGGTSINYKTGDWREYRPVFLEKIAPCQEACPVGNNIPAFLKEVKNKRLDLAWQILMQENPFPSICGRVCFHPCEDACNRKIFDESVSINALERFVGDYGLHKGLTITKPKIQFEKPIAVVGSGPAGLSCAYHLRRLGYDVKIFERSSALGGMLRWGIPNYRLPEDILNREIDRILSLGVQVETGASINKDFFSAGLEEFAALFLAIGAQKTVSLGIEGEDLPGVFLGLQFLSNTRKKNRQEFGEKVVIVGGGNTAIDVARTVLRLGSQPTILYRRTQDEMPAVEEEVRESLLEGVKIEFLTTPVSIKNAGENKLQIECVRNRLGNPDADGRRLPVQLVDSNFMIEADNVILAIGESVETEIFPDNFQVTENGVYVDKLGATSIPGVFAGGDVVSGYRTVSHAIGAGKKAAASIDSFINKRDNNRLESAFLGNKGAISLGEYIQPLANNRRNDRVVKFEELNHAYFQKISRVKIPKVDEFQKRITSFAEVNLTVSSVQAISEAERCFQCGTCSLCEVCYTFCPDSALSRVNLYERFEIDYDYCKGCGICANECPSCLIEMVREEK